MENQYDVSQYLKTRLEQLGLERMFGVAGNYTAAFLNTILQDKNSPIVISGNSNEICAGYAADGYARLKGIGALYVTHSVGAFSLLNTIAGSYAEQVPLILINGAPTNKEDSVEKNAGLIYAHTTGNMVPDIEMFRGVTVAAERITNARQAIFQIDSVLTAMLTYKRPVYIEVTEDVWRAACPPPQGMLTSGAGSIITASETAMAVQAAMNLITSKPKSVFWAGIELQRYGLQEAFLGLLETANTHAKPGKEIHFVTSPLSKSVISENHAYFEGCVSMTQTEIQTLTGTNGCVIGIGAWTTGKDTGNQNIRSDNTIFAANDGVWVGALFFPLISLADFIQQLQAAFAAMNGATKSKLQGLRVSKLYPKTLVKGVKANNITYDSFFASVGSWITEDDTVVVDAGFPLVGAQSVKIPARNGFVAQASWLAIGYSVASAIGVKCAQPNKRVMVVVGDGAFHETCQAVADQHAYGQNTVVFVLANGIYGIEQEIVNPNPFRQPPVAYTDDQLDSIYPYNKLPKWNYNKITDAFGGEGRKASTINELKRILEEIRLAPDTNFVVEITIPTTDVPASIFKGLVSAVGEDEIQNPNWPPIGVF